MLDKELRDAQSGFTGSHEQDALFLCLGSAGSECAKQSGQCYGSRTLDVVVE